jgi:hypothetical protein
VTVASGNIGKAGSREAAHKRNLDLLGNRERVINIDA